MARKGWDQLSAGYRKRLEKGGITKTAYERGESIQAARGHAQTPERPSGAKNFPTYQAEQTRLIQRVAAKKNAFFNTSPKWNPKKEAERFRLGQPSLAMLRKWAAFTKEEWLSAIRQSEYDEIRFFGYH